MRRLTETLAWVLALVAAVLVFMGASALGYLALGDNLGGYLFAVVIFVAGAGGAAWLARRHLASLL
jgi:hypothetical protein